MLSFLKDAHKQKRRQFLQQMALLGASASLGVSSNSVWAKAKNQAQFPKRIVSVGGALTEIIYALNAHHELVGVDTTSLYPEIATQLPSVGYARSLSSEGILALKPTHLLATEEAGPKNVLNHIKGSGVWVTVLSANHRFEGVLERIAQTGDLIDRSNEAQKLIAKLKEEWLNARKPILERQSKPSFTALSVLFVLSHNPNQVMVAGKNSAAEAMIHYAGARNAVEGFNGFKPLTPEAVIAAQPDVVLFTDQGLKAIGGINAALKLPGIQQTPAGQKRRIVSQEAMLMLGFGPRFAHALSLLDSVLLKAMNAL